MQNIERNTILNEKQNIFDSEQQESEWIPYTRIVCNNNVWHARIAHKIMYPIEPDCSKHEKHEWIPHSVQGNIHANSMIVQQCSYCDLQLTKCQTQCRYCGSSELFTIGYD